MHEQSKRILAQRIRRFSMPRYQQIPDVGLYLEQTTQYIQQILEPLGLDEVTGSMISNYVKKGLIVNPVKKRYSREQIAYLLFILMAKHVLSLEQLRLFIAMQKRTYSAQKAYDYICEELENVLGFVFGQKEALEDVGMEKSWEKQLLRNTIIALAHKIHLDLCFAGILQEEQAADH